MNESTANIIKTLNKYKVYIGIGVGVAIAASAGSLSFITMNKKKTQAAWQNLWKINKDLTMALEPRGKEAKERDAALSSAANAYKYIRDNMSSTSATPWVLFQLGNVSYRLKNYDEAIQAYNDFLNRYRSHSLSPIVRQSLGYAYEEKGLLSEAVQQFETVAAQNSFLTAQVEWDAGRCYEKLGQTDDAVRSYTRAVELSPNSSCATLAQYRLSAIR
ncbi:MAG: tetratricopeptide repeat protein [wastewater metagenome]|nr:tetratricopeptide repeat protein [Candidatus Loosdrechtia aerotolerans]